MRSIICKRAFYSSIIAFLGVTVVVLFAVGCGESMVADSGIDGDAEAAAQSATTNRAHGGGAVKNFVAPLSGNQEVPPVDTKARGLAKFKLNKAGDELSFKLNIANINNVTQAHIHCGAADVNGPVVTFLFGFVSGGVTINGTLAEGTITASDVIARPDSPVCPGGVANFDDLIEKMMTGEAYVNVHTTENPPGEIRGQIDRGNGVAR